MSIGNVETCSKSYSDRWKGGKDVGDWCWLRKKTKKLYHQFEEY